jgi:hypothetical protein
VPTHADSSSGPHAGNATEPAVAGAAGSGGAGSGGVGSGDATPEPVVVPAGSVATLEPGVDPATDIALDDPAEPGGDGAHASPDAHGAVAVAVAEVDVETAPVDGDAVPAERGRRHRLGLRSIAGAPRRLVPARFQRANAEVTGEASRFRVGDYFQVPREGDDAPDGGQMVGICAWATALGVVGLVVALRGLIAIIGGHTPAWYEPALISAGTAGILLTVGAFLSIHRTFLPWIMMGLATIPLTVSIALTVVAL